LKSADDRQSFLDRGGSMIGDRRADVQLAHGEGELLWCARVMKKANWPGAQRIGLKLWTES